jgi:hypothetical protein
MLSVAQLTGVKVHWPATQVWGLQASVQVHGVFPHDTQLPEDDSGVKTQLLVAFEHASTVQALLSLHTIGTLEQPEAATQESIVQLFPSSQFTAQTWEGDD